MNIQDRLKCPDCKSRTRHVNLSNRLLELPDLPGHLLIRCADCSEPLGFIEKPRTAIAEFEACQILLRSFSRLHWRDRIFLTVFSRYSLKTSQRHEQFKRLARRYGLNVRIPADVIG